MPFSKRSSKPALGAAPFSPPLLVAADLRSRSSMLHFASTLRLPRVWAPGTPSTSKPAGRVRSPDLACALIKQESTARSLPAFFFAKLIWKESAFNPAAISPKGAKGIAQFMPATAFERGLADPFDVGQAIPHSASYLRDLHDQFGSLGLAAAAYNAGPQRVADWLSDLRSLPLETIDYVATITGRSADDWKLGQVADVDLHWPDIATFDADCARLQKVGLALVKQHSAKRPPRTSSRFPPLVACEAGRLCRVSRR
jgi:hypothetical protein